MRGWLQRHRPAYLAGKESVSDMIQSAYRIAHEHKSQFAGASDEQRAAWFRTIVRNKLHEVIRRYKAEKRDACRELREQVSCPGDAPVGQLPDIDQLPDALAVRREINGVVCGVLEELPDENLEVIYLCFHESLSRKVISEKLGVSPGTVANRMRTAFNLLRATLSGRTDLIDP